LDSEIPYYYVSEGKDLLANIEWAMPYNAAERGPVKFYLNSKVPNSNHSGIDILNYIRTGRFNFEEYFNYNDPEPMDIASLSERLANTIEADYKLKNATPTNKLLISRAIVGAHIPDPGVSATEAGYHLDFTWANLTAAEYLRSFARPFSTLSGEMQLISSSIKGETIQETELHVHQAEYIGSWVDATVGAFTSFTPAGWVLNTAQSAADIAADVTEGKEPDPLAITALIVGCIPGGKIAAKVGKFSRIGGKAVKYGLMLGNKTVDLAIVGKSIKTAVDTGEPLAIYQAFLASGMSVKNSYDMAKNMSSKLKISRKMEESAPLEKLEALQNNAPEYSLSSTMPVRTFSVGATEMLGKINHGGIEISRNNGVTWERGSKLHLLAYRLQNAGGGRQLPAEGKSTYQDPTQSDENPSEYEKDARVMEYSGPSGSNRLTFDQVTKHYINLNIPTRVILSGKFARTKIQSFDSNSSKFKNSNDFTLARAKFSTKKSVELMPSDSLTASLDDMESKTLTLTSQLEQYSGSDKEAITENLKIIGEALDDIRNNINSSDSSIYGLVKKDVLPGDISNHYGMVHFKYTIENAHLYLSDLIAHPYVI
ncbi:hypothetical protein V2A85_23380, partial [Yersinia sp. 1252 StPb PI]|uniref:hypothetical protein n=1 Tax=Yersinia sp. 1252 StPb PI TaxID=3117404 RepID=UPI003B27D3BC